MSRTTLNLDPTILAELRKRADQERKSMGELASELLAVALAASGDSKRRPFKWFTQPLNARIPMEDWALVKEFLDNEDMDSFR